MDEHIHQLALIWPCSRTVFYYYFSFYLCILPAQPTCELLDSPDGSKEATWPSSLPPHITIRHQVGTWYPTGPQWTRADIKGRAAFIQAQPQPQPRRHVLNQSSSRNSAPLHARCTLTGGKGAQGRGVSPLPPSSKRHLTCPPGRAGTGLKEPATENVPPARGLT